MKNSNSQSGFLNLRVLLAFSLCSVGVLLAMLSFAAAPSNAIKDSASNSPPDSLFVTQHAGPSSGNTKAASHGLSQTGPGCTVVSTVNDKCPSWIGVYDNPNGHTLYGLGYEKAAAIVVSPDGNRTYVTGSSNGRGVDASTDGDAFTTVAYNAATGAQEWVARYDGGASSVEDDPAALALTRDGSRLYVLGTSYPVPTTVPGVYTGAFTVVAYDTAAGSQLWVAQHQSSVDIANGAAGAQAIAIAVSADGTRIFVTGLSGNNIDGTLFRTTVAFDSSGQELWSTSYGGPFNVGSVAALQTSPAGDRLYVTGSVCRNAPSGGHCDFEAATIAYDGLTGTQLWLSLHSAAIGDVIATAVQVSPVGDRIYITGRSCVATDMSGNCISNSFTTIAYDASGTQQWLVLYPGPQGESGAVTMALSPAGDKLFVAGATCLVLPVNNVCEPQDFATVAYDTVSGSQLWTQTYGLAGYPFEIATGIVVGPDGRNVYVLGESSTSGATPLFQGFGVSAGVFISSTDYVALSYGADTGTQQWVARYNSSPARSDGDIEAGIGISPDGSRLFITGTQEYSGVIAQGGNHYDFGTVAYDTGLVPVARIVSRKVHGNAGQFDINLPLAGPHGIECRTGGANGDYMMIFTFVNTLTSVGGASVTNGTGTVSARTIDSSDAHNYVVNLTGVTNAQTITVSLTDVTDSAGDFSSAVSASMGVLVGDVNASGVVTSGDTNLCKAQALQPVTNANFRNDVNASGAITTGDVNIIKQNALTHL